MKISTKRRLLSLLLASIIMSAMPAHAMLSSHPRLKQNAAIAMSSGTGEGVGGSGEDTSAVTSIILRADASDGLQTITAGEKYSIILEPSASASRGARIVASLQPDNDETQAMRVVWVSKDPETVKVSEQEGSHTATIYGVSPGTTDITVTAGGKSCTIATTVSGIKLSPETAAGISVRENETEQVRLDVGYFTFGNATSTSAKLKVSIVDNKPNVYATVEGTTITLEGREAGAATVALEILAGGSTYRAEIPVTVISNEQVIPYTEGCSVAKPLKFSALEEKIAAKYKEMFPGGSLTSIIGLNVPTAQGTLYLGYKSPEDTGAGVGGSVTYYYHTGARGPYISDITFVPNASFSGEKAVITFTGQGTDSGGSTRTFKGKIEVTLTDEKTDLTVSTKRNTPLPLTYEQFSKICQEQLGSPLDYVVFTLPPASQGALYLDYKDEWNYASKVSPNEKYDRRALDAVTFVPAETYVGEVRIGYAGYSVSGSKYNGELVIQVQQGLDDAITYNDNGSGLVKFSRLDFNDFSINAAGKALSSVSFTLPPASQGVLYLNWTGSRGTAVTEGASYTPVQLDRMTFVAAGGFHGVVRIPFTGTSLSGVNFKGTVELHIQSSGSGGGDIDYVCAPGQSVKLSLSDFADLCQSLTGQRLHYISFQSLPDFNQGSLYHNRTSSGAMGSRVTTAARYFNSAAPYLSNLSFWATDRFSRVQIPFTGSSVNGQTFTGILAISSGAGAGSGAAGSVNYSTTGQTPVTFSGGDFDAACREATNAALSRVQLGLPASGQGILYYNYRAGSAPKALDAGTDLYRSGETSVDRVTFVAAKGFAGTASIPFTGWSIDGREFQGAVQITVRADAALGGLVRYESHGEPVHLSAYDIQTASGGTPSSLRLTGLPDASQGKLYYQYSGPTQYSWEGNTTTVYSLYGDPSVSSLTFVPKAGFYGTAEIPYTASNGDGTQYTGTIRVTVTEPSASANFDDLSGYSAQLKSAVDFLYDLQVVRGTGQRRYEPGASIRRGDFCVMLSRAFRFNVGSDAQGFSDVPADAYYAQAVNEMYALGVVNGVGGGRFEPSTTLTRQDAALMVQRALNQAGVSVPDGNAAALAAYGDQGQVAAYARGAVAGLAQMGLLPTRDRLISPRDSLNRGDMALMLHRAMTQ